MLWLLIILIWGQDPRIQIKNQELSSKCRSVWNPAPLGFPYFFSIFIKGFQNIYHNYMQKCYPKKENVECLTITRRLVDFSSLYYALFHCLDPCLICFHILWQRSRPGSTTLVKGEYKSPPHLEPIHLTPKSLILLKKTKNEIRMGGGGGSDNWNFSRGRGWKIHFSLRKKGI